MIPFNPESIEALQARLPAALEKVHRVGLAADPDESLPALHQQHVFDCVLDGVGVRTIVSLEHGPDLEDTEAGTLLHVSVSASNKSQNTTLAYKMAGILFDRYMPYPLHTQKLPNYRSASCWWRWPLD